MASGMMMGPSWRWYGLAKSRAQKTPARLELDEFELCVLLAPPPDVRSSSRSSELPALLRSSGVEDLHSLRREVNRRLVPTTVMRSMIVDAQQAGRISDGQAKQCLRARPSEGDVLPSDEEELVGLAERILDLVNLQELLLLEWTCEEEHEEACGELLRCGVCSVEMFSRYSLDELQSRNSSTCRRNGFRRLQEEALRQCTEGPEGELSRRCMLVPMGSEPLLFTAPHNLFLRRDGQAPHMLEEMTSWLALMLGQEVQGTSLCWTRAAQWRSELCFALGKRRQASGVSASAGQALDPANRDPNFLRTKELRENAWFSKVEAWVKEHRRNSQAERRRHVLHVDVHGCQDPPKHPAHAMLGLGAMRQHAEALPQGSAEREEMLHRLDVFASQLRSRVGPALASLLGLEPAAAAVLTGLTPNVKDEQGHYIQTLSGAWPPETRRLTQTQQSISHAGATHALQLELGRTLRYALVKNPGAVAQLARAIAEAWEQSLRAEGPSSSFETA